ncbi:hypothetical protein SCHPADRAFT_942940 [Schizopora paradoxa]|uniref:Uncharacterized protein n=1 Tax=Schizopora paradoxa TaxID=27342 RepID=A0A0H2REQ0_9AGAM|nr:hypothetical protein SCHPADRAFT_942940 [Schizopora paradoxa]
MTPPTRAYAVIKEEIKCEDVLVKQEFLEKPKIESHLPSPPPTDDEKDGDYIDVQDAKGSKKRKAGAEGRVKGAKRPKTTHKVKDVKPPPTDPSTWRASRQPFNASITKGDAVQQYRLDRNKDFSKLKPREYITRAGYTALLFWVRDIERIAWAKHGSPEGFDYYISKLRETYNKKNAKTPQKKPFCEPAQYIDRFTAIMRRYDQEMATLKEYFPTWLWRLIQSHLEDTRIRWVVPVYDEYYDIEEAESMVAKVRVFRQQLKQGKIKYPLRPFDPVPESASFTALKGLLDNAPGRHGFNWDDPPEGIETYEDHELNGWHDWTKKLQREVDVALEAVIAEHGGRYNLQARWMVYDTYVQCVKGPVYLAENSWRWKSFWIDDAKRVLDNGRLLGETL